MATKQIFYECKFDDKYSYEIEVVSVTDLRFLGDAYIQTMLVKKEINGYGRGVYSDRIMLNAGSEGEAIRLGIKNIDFLMATWPEAHEVKA